MLMARPAYSPAQVDEIQSQILANALSAFRREGIKGLTLRAVARESQMTSAALYRYFKNKQHLLEALRIAGFKRIGEELAQVEATVSDPLEGVRCFIRIYLGFAMNEPHLFSLMYQLDQGETPPSTELSAQRSTAFGHARAIIARAVDAGAMQMDANIATHVIWCGIHGLAALAMSNQLDQGCSYDELVEPLISNLLRSNSSIS